MTIFPTSETQHVFAGPVGNLEAIVCATSAPTPRGIGVVCHPHPLYGGTMHNKVVTTLFKALLDAGYHALRFNYRGIGASEGTYAGGIGETDDTLALVHALHTDYPNYPIILAGFSFGAYVATRASLVMAPAPKALITLAPPVHHCDFASISVIPCPWTVIIADEDEIVPISVIDDFLQTRTEPVRVVHFPKTSHFFHGQLLALKEKMSQILCD